MASPLSGLGGRPPLRPLVDALDAVLLRDAEFAALPGRFLFSLDDGTGGASLAACDVGLLLAGDAVELVIAGRLAGVRAGRRPGRRHGRRGCRVVGASPRRPGRPSRRASGATSAASPTSRTAGHRWPRRSAARSARRRPALTAACRSARRIRQPEAQKDHP